MNTLYASNFLKGSVTGGLQEAYNKAQVGDQVVLDKAATATATVNLNRNGIEVTLAQNLAYLVGNKLIGLSLTGENEVDGPGSILGTGLSAIMLSPGADGSYLHDFSIGQYNQTDTNGHAAVFGYGMVYSPQGPVLKFIQRLRIENISTSDGNGNGIRLQNVQGSRVIGCRVSRTHGQSAEGYTWGGQGGQFIGCYAEYAWTTSLLFFNGTLKTDKNYYDYQDILVKNCIFACGSQQPGVGSHPAIGLAPRGGKIIGFSAYNNVALDNQVKPTMSELLLVYDGGLGGIVENGTVGANFQSGCINPKQVAYNLKNPVAQLINWEDNE